MLRCDQARIDREAAPLDGEVVVAALELDAAHLDDAQPAAFGTKSTGFCSSSTTPCARLCRGTSSPCEERSSRSSTVQR